jgi:hypothetical protein
MNPTASSALPLEVADPEVAAVPSAALPAATSRLFTAAIPENSSTSIALELAVDM